MVKILILILWRVNEAKKTIKGQPSVLKYIKDTDDNRLDKNRQESAQVLNSVKQCKGDKKQR